MMNNPFKRHQSLVYALSMFLLLSGWLASGYLGSEEQITEAQTDTTARSLIQKVRVRVPEVKRVVLEIVLNGRTEAARAVTLRAEVEGQIVSITTTHGAILRKGELILQFDKRDRQARLAEAHALLKQRELEHAGAKKLQKNNLQSEIFVARITSQLATSKALVERIELEIRNTRILAPFDGILDSLPVEVGSYLKAGDEIGRLLEQDPIIFVGYVSQQERHRLVLGDRGIARLVTGAVAEGELRYISSEADPFTRTFRVELQTPNPDRSLVSGITAEISIPVRSVSAIQLSSALLSLNSEDILGVKTVNAQDRVEFLPIQIVKSSPNGLWISGLPKEIRVITVGQGFVRTGDKVIAIDEQEIAGSETSN
jgi:multidrug efflux system membrane fusion protein